MSSFRYYAHYDAYRCSLSSPTAKIVETDRQLQIYRCITARVLTNCSPPLNFHSTATTQCSITEPHSTVVVSQSVGNAAGRSVTRSFPQPDQTSQPVGTNTVSTHSAAHPYAVYLSLSGYTDHTR